MSGEITLKDQITNKVCERFIELTDKKTFDIELSFALQHINKNPQLKKATVESNVIREVGPVVPLLILKRPSRK